MCAEVVSVIQFYTVLNRVLFRAMPSAVMYYITVDGIAVDYFLVCPQSQISQCCIVLYYHILQCGVLHIINCTYIYLHIM